MARPDATSAWCALLAWAVVAGAQTAVAQAPSPRLRLELHAWGGYSAFSNPPQSPATTKDDGVGVRSLEIALWPSASLRLFGRYDNSLSLDNLTLLRTGQRVPTWSGGGLVNWGGHFTTVIRAGRRTLPGGFGQTLVGLEQVAYTTGGSALKAGAEVGRRADHRTEWVAHAGINAPAGARVRVEPVVFYGRSGIAGESQWRALLASELRLGQRSSLGAGLAGGRTGGSPAGFNGTVWDGYARATAAVGDQARVHLLVRHERAPGFSPLTSVALGLSLFLSRP